MMYVSDYFGKLKGFFIRPCQSICDGFNHAGNQFGGQRAVVSDETQC
jgi:hypothetical protein